MTKQKDGIEKLSHFSFNKKCQLCAIYSKRVITVSGGSIGLCHWLQIKLT